MRERKRRRNNVIGFYWCCLYGYLLLLMLIIMALALHVVSARFTLSDPMLTTTQTQTLLLGMDNMLNAGDVIQITTIISNTGPIPVTNISISDSGSFGTICVPMGVDNEVGTLLPGESATCFGMYTITQMDIDAMMFQANSTVVGSGGVAFPVLVFLVDSTTNLTQTTFGALNVGQMVDVDLGPDDFLAPGDTVEVTVKLTNIGTETLLNITSTNFNGTLIPELLPLESVNFTYVIVLTQPILDNQFLTLNETGMGIGTTSAQPVIDMDVFVVNVTQTLEGRLRTITSFMNSSECTGVGEILVIDVVVENYGTTPVMNVQVTNSLIGTGLICSPSGVDNTIATLLPGQQETCSGGYMLTGSDVTAGLDTLFTSDTMASGFGSPDADELNLTYTYPGKNRFWFDYRFNFTGVSTGYSSLDFTPPTPTATFITNVVYGPFTQCDATTAPVKSYGSLSGRTTVVNNFVLHPRHLQFFLYIGGVDNGSLIVTTDPPGLAGSWEYTNTGPFAGAAAVWTPATGTIVPLGAPCWAYFTISNLGEINQIIIEHVGHTPGDFMGYWFGETINTTIVFP